MSDDPVDKAIKRHYQQQTLSPEAMARMVAMADSLDQNKRQKKKVRFWRRRWWLQRNVSLAASMVIALLVVSWVWESNTQLLADVAQEVALNHNKHMASEYIADDFQRLASVMDKLDFNLVFPARLQQAGYQVIGARYCSIQGGIAAQVKLRAGDGEQVTLYQTKLNGELAALDGQRYVTDNVSVQTWQDGDVFFGLASTATLDPK